jgi:WD40 repeat protein
MHGDVLLSSGGDRTIRAWNTNTWLCERTLEREPDSWGTQACDNLVMHGEKLIEGRTNFGGVILVWNTDTWTCERTIDDNGDAQLRCLAVHGGNLFSGFDDLYAQDEEGDFVEGDIKVHNTDTWACEHTLVHKSVSSLLAYGGVLLSGSFEGTIKIWSTDTWACTHVLHHTKLSCLVMHGGMLLSGSTDATIKVWDPTRTWTCKRTICSQTQACADGVRCLEVHGNTLISGGREAIKVWRAPASPAIRTAATAVHTGTIATPSSPAIYSL